MKLSDVPLVPGVEHRDVAVNGVRLHVAEAGAGPPLILLHGWPQHWWCWRRLVLRLAEDYRVLAPDLRGWGWSDAPRDDYAKTTFAADILALMDAEGLDRVSLLGHDWGGYTSFLLSLEHPERIERMIALEVTPPWLGRLQARHLAAPLMGSYQALLATPILGPATMTSGNGFVRRFIRAGSGPAMRWSDDELDVYARVLRDPRRANASSACYRSFLTRELPASLLGGYGPDDLDVPVLTVMGENSPIRRVLNPQPSPNLRVEGISGAGHFLPEEAPERVLEHARAPRRSVTARSAGRVAPAPCRSHVCHRRTCSVGSSARDAAEPRAVRRSGPAADAAAAPGSSARFRPTRRAHAAAHA